MSDTAQGPSWWQAGDGRWYPPELRRPPARRQAGKRPADKRPADKPSVPPGTAQASGPRALTVLDDGIPQENAAPTDRSSPAVEEDQARTPDPPDDTPLETATGSSTETATEPPAEPDRESDRETASGHGSATGRESESDPAGENEIDVGTPDTPAADRHGETRSEAADTTPTVTTPEAPPVPSAFSLPVRPVAASRPTRGSTPRSGIPSQLLRPRRGGGPRVPVTADGADPGSPPDRLDEQQFGERAPVDGTAGAVTEPIGDPQPSDVLRTEAQPGDATTAAATPIETADAGADIVDVAAMPGDDLLATVPTDGAGAYGHTESDAHTATWSTSSWDTTAETGVGDAPGPSPAAPEWGLGTEAEVSSPLGYSGTESSGEELDTVLPSPEGSVAPVAEPLSIHSLLFGADVPLVVDEADEGYGTDQGYGTDGGASLHDSAPTEILSGEWAAPVAPEAPPATTEVLATDQAAVTVPDTIAGEAPAAPPFVLIASEPQGQVPPPVAAGVPAVVGAEPVTAEPVTAEPVAAEPVVVAGHPVGSEVPAGSEVPTEPKPEPGSAVNPPAGTEAPRPEATSVRAKKNADLFKGGPEFPDIFKLAMEGTSIGSNVSVRYDAASPRSKEAASSTTKGAIPGADDKAGKRRRRRSSH